MNALLLVCLLAVSVVVAVLRPAWADLCVKCAGTMAVLYVVAQIVRVILAAV